MRILHINHPRDITRIMQDIKVDPYGIRIMSPKATTYLLKLNSISNICANILKQEMLSLGADAAVARGALTGAVKKTDCLLMGNLAQFAGLSRKLNKQPFGLNAISENITKAIRNYGADNLTLGLKSQNLRLGRRTLIMGVVNATPDSFSGDGITSVSEAVDLAQKLAKDGADIIDVGGESSRPGARPVPLEEELKRTIPLIKALTKSLLIPVSIDTCKPEVARQALDNGAAMINDISGMREARMAKIAAKYKAAVVLMHMKGNPRTMQNDPSYTSLMDEVLQYLQEAIDRALEAGIDRERIVIDPGIGFGKTVRDNLNILNNLNEFKILGRPILIGTSRKSFIGRIINAGPRECIYATVSSSVLAAHNGAHIVRTHDVREVSQALKILDAANRQ
ncbi:MAG: dihydropteroate synthase [Candidatus Omnitrophica bacterium]|nr:dihydropteroate synthase [Candidatus Omnitrophota bacterium]